MWYNRKHTADKAFLPPPKKPMNSIQPLDITSLLKTQELEKQMKWHYTEVIQQIQYFTTSWRSLPDSFLQLRNILSQEFIHLSMACFPPK